MKTHIFNWIAVLVLEVFAVLWWLCSWATQASLFAFWTVYGFGYYNYDTDYDGLRKRYTSAYNGYLPVLAAALALSIIQL